MRDKEGMGRAISYVTCTFSPAKNTSGTASYFYHCPNPDISEYVKDILWFEDCQESSRRRAALQNKANWEPGVETVLVGVVSSPSGVRTTVTKEGR